METMQNYSAYGNGRNLAFNAILSSWRAKYPPKQLFVRLALIFGHETAKHVLSRYIVTSEAGGWLVWWQTDGRGTATTARITAHTWDGCECYDSRPGWVHARERRAGRTPAGYNPPKHFYGLHLLKPGARVLVVDDEISALYLAALTHAEPTSTIARRYDTILAACGAASSAAWNDREFMRLAASVDICPDGSGQGWQDVADRHGWRLVHIIPGYGQAVNIADYVTQYRKREFNEWVATLTPHGYFVDPRRRESTTQPAPCWLTYGAPFLSPWPDGVARWQVIPNEATKTFFVVKCHHVTGEVLDVCQVPAPSIEPGDHLPAHDFESMKHASPAAWRSYLWSQEAAGSVRHYPTDSN